MPNYENGKIYTIRCHTDSSLIYVGSTIKKLCDRKSNHKSNSLICPENPLYKKISENGGWDNFYIELYELCPCKSKEELTKREGEIVREIATLNSQIPRGIDKKSMPNNEYQKLVMSFPDRKLKKQQSDKKYRETHQEYLKEILVCQCGSKIQRKCLSQHLKTEKHKFLMSSK